MILRVISFLLFMTQAQVFAANDWSNFKDDAIGMIVKMKNKSHGDLIGQSEFLTRTTFIPYNDKNEPIPVLIELRFDSAIPRTIGKGQAFHFTKRIPFRHFLEDPLLDLSQVAYFVIHYQIVEDDFFVKQKAIEFEVKLTPFGYPAFSKIQNKKVLANQIKTQKIVTEKVEASAFFSLDISQTMLQRANEKQAEALAHLNRILAEIKID